MNPMGKMNADMGGMAGRMSPPPPKETPDMTPDEWWATLDEGMKYEIMDMHREEAPQPAPPPTQPMRPPTQNKTLGY